MTIKIFAQTMGISVKSLVKYSGLSKRELYNLIEKNEPTSNPSFNDFIEQLQTYSNNLFNMEAEKAINQKKERDKLIEQLRSTQDE